MSTTYREAQLEQELAEARAEITRLVEEIAEHVKARAEQRAAIAGSGLGRDDVLRLAREAGMMDGYSLNDAKLERFASLVAAAERSKTIHPIERQDS